MENPQKAPKTKSVKVILASMRALQALALNPKTSQEELMGIIREFTGDDEDLTGAACFLTLAELQRLQANKKGANNESHYGNA